jgi:group I intron endonuclease
MSRRKFIPGPDYYYGVIYEAKLSGTERRYFGQTVDPPARRKSVHIRLARSGHKGHFYNAIRKYGIHNFEWSIKFYAINKQDLDMAECFYIAEYNTTKTGFNISSGGVKATTYSKRPWNYGIKTGKPSWNRGKKPSNETIEKIRINTRRPRPWMKGKPMSDSARIKIGLNSKQRQAKKFICLNNNKIYFNKTEAGKDLGLNPGSISAFLNGSTTSLSLKGYVFKYTEDQVGNATC